MPCQDCLSQVDLGMLYGLQQAKWNAANANAMRDQTTGWVPPAPGKAMFIFWPAKLSSTWGLRAEWSRSPRCYVMPTLFICVIKAKSKLAGLLSTQH